MQFLTEPGQRSAKTLLAAMFVFADFLLGESAAQEKVLNLYTARHYSTDESFYTGYTKAHRHQDQPHRRRGGRAFRAHQSGRRQQPGGRLPDR